MLVPFINEPWHKAVNWVGVVFLFLGWVLFGIATVLTVVSGFNYIWKNRHVFTTEQTSNENAPLDNTDNSEILNSSDNCTTDNACVDSQNGKEKEND